MFHPSFGQQDRRVSQRYRVSIPCTFHCTQESYTGIATNVSIDGAFVVVDRIPPVGSLGELHFEGKRGQEMIVRARVVYNSPDTQGFGLYFLDFDEANLDLLKSPISE